MKGVVFTNFFDMVEDKFGYQVVDNIINQSKVKSDGAYTGVGTYDHSELLSLVGCLHKEVNVPVSELLEAYGFHLFPILAKIITQLLEQFNSCFDILEGLDGIIHKEVLKLYPDAELPKFELISRDKSALTIEYTSCRPFSNLAKGLIQGCAEYYGENINIELSHQNTSDKYSTLFTLTKNT